MNGGFYPNLFFCSFQQEMGNFLEWFRVSFPTGPAFPGLRGHPQCPCAGQPQAGVCSPAQNEPHPHQPGKRGKGNRFVRVKISQKMASWKTKTMQQDLICGCSAHSYLWQAEEYPAPCRRYLKRQKGLGGYDEIRPWDGKLILDCPGGLKM